MSLFLYPEKELERLGQEGASRMFASGAHTNIGSGEFFESRWVHAIRGTNLLFKTKGLTCIRLANSCSAD